MRLEPNRVAIAIGFNDPPASLFQGNSRGAQTANQKSATTKTIAGDAAIRGGTPMTLAISTALTKTTPTLLN
ncbi:hypothetical protein [Phormidium sp. CCY1219]|uniref:hypothetical protein n=1 Tax=Phormidium sp. CCY1219 TaxID=2886104 RepID=UPI002D1F86C5|nr:hypothetical protein [Phormidium sp. CCY1219]MEB3829714.1 hypothetical protein [Phormidium sp. CCY1219]